MSEIGKGGSIMPCPLPYSPPQGPKGMTNSPGLGQDNYGNGQQPGRSASTSGRPGLGGTNHSMGTQGKR
jgi:hypothetical protein